MIPPPPPRVTKKKQKKTPKGQRPINLSETPNYLQQTASKEKQEPNPTTK
jgi:hypothetical protein